ncbi:MAG: CBS domain-containing protein [Ilumatobacter sp.]|uniref:magnesium transporter MgtE N-terminal domain-containing protein n=1 Tax=Ilumatobacter sp. TaxID=1967498 RepID=UPI00262405AE|nr:CBS domain-containing protein [Ilumatobacter sp.]MDJ0771435.1 CBS domain-containing protein [Ilumatobacter sp.]
MAGELIYAFRVMRLPLLDAGGSEIGKIDDIVVVPGREGRAPRVVGFVASSQRRRIFVNAARVADLDGDGARLRSWDIDLNPFKRRTGETLIGSELIDKVIATGERVSDVGLVETIEEGARRWRVSKVRLARRSTLRRRPNYRLVDWTDVPHLFATGTAMEAEAARLRDMHKSDVAHIVRSMPLAQRRQLAESMDDERLADVLEELPEAEQLRLIEGLDLDRLIDVFDEMEYDDLADLLGEMPQQQRAAILEAMDDDEAEVVTRLLSYEESTAGGMMTPELVILGPDATVAEALAQIRDPDWTPSIASQVFVTRAPYKPPTGRFMGVVFMQRLLREPPSMELRHCIAEDTPVVAPDTIDRAVFEEFASYDMLALAVVDEAGRFLGAVSVDDVVDRMLGAGWRSRHRRQDRSLDARPEPIADAGNAGGAHDPADAADAEIVS